MSKRYAVSQVNFRDWELKIHFVDASNWFEALCKVDSMFNEMEGETLEECKQFAFDCDGMIDVQEVP